VNSIATLVNEVIAISTVSMEDVVAIGLVLPGLLDVENGIAVAVANFPSFKEYPLVSSVQKLIPKPVSPDDWGSTFHFTE
jgi:predicted NBD/HSP70 family sugar kinase